MSPIIVSYATDDDRYRPALERLIESCERHGIEHSTELFPPHDRKEVQLYKPTFILDQLSRHQQQVVWLDADSVVTGCFDLPYKKWDIGLIPNNRKSQRNPVCSFVVAARPTPEAEHFLEVWKYLCDWPGLSRFPDHARLVWARGMAHESYREIDLTDSITGCVVRDKGNNKEWAV